MTERTLEEALNHINNIHAEINRRKIPPPIIEHKYTEPKGISCEICETENKNKTWEIIECTGCGARMLVDGGLELTERQIKILREDFKNNQK